MIEPLPAADPVPALRVSTPAELIELVPYLVGFHPAASIVFVGLNGPRERVGITLRLDIAAARAAPDSLRTCAGHLSRSGASGVIVVVYADTADTVPDRGHGGRGHSGGDGHGTQALPHAELVSEVSDVLTRQRLALGDAILVSAGRWWSYLCSDPACCPACGHELPAGDKTSQVAAAVAVAGMTAAPDRDALVASIAPLPLSERAGLASITRELADRSDADRGSRYSAAMARWSAAVRAQQRGEALIVEAEAAALLEALRDVRVRDACCGWAKGPGSHGARAVVRQLARRATAPWDVAPYALLAWFAWRDGEGALSQIAVERALASDPGCTFARLIQEMIDRGIDPRVWRDPPRMGGDDGPRPLRRRRG